MTTPTYSHPFTLSQAIQLEPALITQEITRLQHSIQHLERSNAELLQYLEEEGPEAEFESSIRENEVTMQKERISILRHALQEQIGVDGSNGHYELASARSDNGTLGSGTSLILEEGDTDAIVSAAAATGPGQEDEEVVEGVYL
ncbi:BZ3500_MvSof-1268-A1-R1_Chr10-2g02970 [Microbotryum saponariae]|uniref:BZ3500_MvSof-1268-A1-R1_Chr10-2g02970 protein n=1 Tax=Microbotryum saponariae TaxID=289078 RepID=A0A2X0K6E6_9BASI|nr:BZ3501_MvSof-1269-A2-R1_Chr10-2g02556 [Microbotryum saponariae]SDA01844.1 BZ3500_MvSof-1268-A1-R1_Chr10-2g02970 [Microbotryum saponariae]